MNQPFSPSTPIASDPAAGTFPATNRLDGEREAGPAEDTWASSAAPEVPAKTGGMEPQANISPVAPASLYVPVGAIEAVLAERTRQIFDFGHTPEADRAANLDHWASKLDAEHHAIVEGIHCGQSREIVRRRLVKHTAQLCALIERLDAEIAEWADFKAKQENLA